MTGTIAGRLQRWAAACLLAAAPLAAPAAPPPGTVIQNQATGSAMSGPAAMGSISNPVAAIVSGGAVAGYSAVLAPSTMLNAAAGATVHVRHTLTNNGTVGDSYTLAIVALGGTWTYTSVSLHADANDDGQPDSAAPLGPVVLAPGQVLRFVATLVVPPTALPLTGSDARISAVGVGGSPIAPIVDRVTVGAPAVPADCGMVAKTLSRERGPSPAGPITVMLAYLSCDKARERILVTDVLPAGMRYVAGSGRWSGTGAAPLTDAVVGADREGAGSIQLAYDYNATAPGAVSFTAFNLPAQAGGNVTFQVQIESGLAIGARVDNAATYRMHDAAGAPTSQMSTNTASYFVTGRADIELTGERLPSATPGTTVAFTNLLTNRGDAPDTFDITLSGSTFPAGTTFALFKPDGVTPLADTDGNGTPDTGVLAGGGATYRIVVRAGLPTSTPPGAYQVTKTARAASMPAVMASALDAVDAVASKCETSFDPDNNAQVGFGQHVVYTHFITNRGNCADSVSASLEYIADSRPGWTSLAFVDNKAGGGGSLPGAVDPTDIAVVQGWSATLGPGESLRILVDVRAPSQEQLRVAAKAKGAKALSETNLTTMVLTSVSSGALTVRDTTHLDDQAQSGNPDNAIRNFVDATYVAPTLWGVVGGDLWLKADATSCNAVPGVAETRTVVLTGPGGERETLTATETGPDTGVFLVPRLPVRSPPVVQNDGVVQGVANDTFEIELTGCGRRIATVVTLMEPASVVFDSASNAPIAGASVLLVGASGGRCSSAPVSVAGANPALTGADGRFAFPPLNAGDYCLTVTAPNGYHTPSTVAWPLLPSGRNLAVDGLTSGGSYGGTFRLGAGGLVVVDIPADAAAQDGLFVQKDASRTVAEVGEFVDYALRLRNSTGNALDRADVTLTDDLPAGFAYVAGSARRDGRTIADPEGGAGPRLTLRVGPMARDEQVSIAYRVRLGPGSLQGDGVNRVQARYAFNGASTLSNVATARVQVTGGVFTDKGFILGKVYLDCDANGVQDKGEPGVPGVRLVLEDGTYVVTDGGGKYSFYGIVDRTHSLKVDRTTLPAGARLAASSARHLGDGGSRIVDLKSGEMHRADFAVAGCAAPLAALVRQRIEAAGSGDELAAIFGSQLATEARAVADVKALPASGLVQLTPASSLAPNAAGGLPAGAGMLQSAPGSAPASVARPVAAGAAAATPAPALAPLESVVPTLDKALGFVGLVDGQTLDFAQSTIRVKGTAGSVFVLTVNDAEVPASRVGKRAVLQDKQVQAWEYIGVALKPGLNTLSVAQTDAFGNARGTATIRVLAPDKLGRVALEVPAAGGVADGRSAVKIVVRLTDEHGTPVMVRTPVTLDAALGRWKTTDLNPAEPGLQVMVEGGVADVELLPPLEPGSTAVVATSGTYRAQARLDFLPELRSLVATGVLEGIVNMRNVNTRALTPARESDGFERELRHLSREWDSGRTQAGARAAFYLKGKIRGDYLLTAAYDSDKDTKERLFRDIQPDEFYPIYGDSGVRGFDAQSTSRLYVRVDHKRSYLLWGDFTTQATVDARKLSNYSRSLTGAKHHFENERVSVNAFASRDSTRQVIEEVRANGTSGPYTLGTPGALVNSEKIEIVTRDRNQPALILSAVAQTRFSDYEIEALTGRLLFRSPVPSVDRNLNPVFVRMTYEVDQGGEQFWVAGVDAQVKLGDRVEVGGMYVKDQNPLLPFTLAGANMTVKVAEGTYVIGEVARSESGTDNKTGDAGRIEVRHESPRFKAQAFVARTEAGFENPGAYLTQGRSEAGGKAEYKLSDRTSLRAEALRTEDVTTHAVRDGLAASIQHQFGERLTLEVGVRHAAERGLTSPVPTIEAPGGGSVVAQPMPEEVTTVRTRVTGTVPGVEGLSVYGEAEVDVTDAERRVLAAGAEYQMANRGRLYARHEFVSSITGPYGLNAAERQNTTAIGVDTEYMRDGRLFSEYRIRDAISGGDTEAALGLRNLWSIAPGLRLGTTLERVHSISGTGQNENTAIALALEYTGSALWKGSTRLEARDGQSTESLLFTVGLAARLARDWTALARNAYTLTRNKDGGGEHVVDRMQAGIAWRDSETNRWNALARVEHRLERNDQQEGIALKSATTLVSLHADWQPRRPFLVSGRYAAKWTRDDSNGLSSRYRAQLVGGRATWEFAPRWDVSMVSSVLFGDSSASRQYGVGLELGYLLATNLWVSAGYNFSGYRDADLAGADYTAKGPFVRLRYKFDESLLETAGAAKTAEAKP